jgi:hypothetical protein
LDVPAANVAKWRQVVFNFTPAGFTDRIINACVSQKFMARKTIPRVD